MNVLFFTKNPNLKQKDFFFLFFFFLGGGGVVVGGWSACVNDFFY